MAGTFADFQSNNILSIVNQELIDVEDSATFNGQCTNIHGKNNLGNSWTRDNFNSPSDSPDTARNLDNVSGVATCYERNRDFLVSHDDDDDDDDDDDADSVDLDRIKKEIDEEEQLECSKKGKQDCNIWNVSGCVLRVKDKIIIDDPIDLEIMHQKEDIRPEIMMIDAVNDIEKDTVCKTDASASLMPKAEEADRLFSSAQYADGTEVNITVVAPVLDNRNFDEEHQGSRLQKTLAVIHSQNGTIGQSKNIDEEGLKVSDSGNTASKAIIEEISCGRISNSLSQQTEEVSMHNAESSAILSIDTLGKDGPELQEIKKNLKRKILGQPLVVRPKPMCTRVTNIPIPGRAGSTNQCIMKVPTNCVPALLKQRVSSTCTTNALQKFVTVWVPYQNLTLDEDRAVKMVINSDDGSCNLTSSSSQSVDGRLCFKDTTPDPTNCNLLIVKESEKNSEAITEQLIGQNLNTPNLRPMPADAEIPSIVNMQCNNCKKNCTTNSELLIHMSACYKALGDKDTTLKTKHPKLATLLGETELVQEIQVGSTGNRSIDFLNEETLISHSSHPVQVKVSAVLSSQEVCSPKLASTAEERSDDSIVCHADGSQSSPNNCSTQLVIATQSAENGPVAGYTPASVISAAQEDGDSISNTASHSKNSHKSQSFEQNVDMLDIERKITTSETIVYKTISTNTSFTNLDIQSYEKNVCPLSDASRRENVHTELHQSSSSVNGSQSGGAPEDVQEPVFRIIKEEFKISDTLQEGSEINCALSPVSHDLAHDMGETASCETFEAVHRTLQQIIDMNDNESYGILQPSSASVHDNEAKAVSGANEESSQNCDGKKPYSALEHNNEGKCSVSEPQEDGGMANCAGSEANIVDNNTNDTSNEATDTKSSSIQDGVQDSSSMATNTKSSSIQDGVGNSSSIEDLTHMIYKCISGGVGDERSAADRPSTSKSPLVDSSSPKPGLQTEKLPVQFMDNDGYIYVRLGPGLKQHPGISCQSVGTESHSADVLECPEHDSESLPDAGLVEDVASNITGTSVVEEESEQDTYDAAVVEVGAETLVCESHDSAMGSEADFQDISTRGSESPGRIQMKLTKSTPYPTVLAITAFGMSQIKQQWLSILQTHWPTRVVCHVCGKVFGGRVFEEHILTHTHIRSYECPKCFINTGSLTYFKKHVKLHEEACEIPFCCLLCGSSYSGLAYYNLHMKKHRERRLNLERVEYEQQLLDAERNEKAETNFLAIKPEVPVYSRELTDGERVVVDAQKSIVQSNMVQDIGQSLSERMKSKKKGTWKTEFTCDLCEKVFTRTRLFNKHLLEHKGAEKDSVHTNVPLPPYSPGSAHDKARLLCFIRQKHAYSFVPEKMKGISFDKESAVYAATHGQRGLSGDASRVSGPDYEDLIQDHSVKSNDVVTTPESDVSTQTVESSRTNDEDNIDSNQDKQSDGKSKRVRYTCHICNKVYMAKRQINKHLIEHYLEQNLPGKSYVCSSCEFTTDNLFALARHERVHVEIKRKDVKGDTRISNGDENEHNDTANVRKLSAKSSHDENPRRSPRKRRSNLLPAIGSVGSLSKQEVTVKSSKINSAVRMSSRIKSRSLYNRYSSSSDNERDLQLEKDASPQNKAVCKTKKRKSVLSKQKAHCLSKERSFILVKADAPSGTSFTLSTGKKNVQSNVPSEEHDSCMRKTDENFVLFSPLKRSSSQLEQLSSPSKQARLVGDTNGKTYTFCKSIENVTDAMDNGDTEQLADDGETSDIKTEKVIILRARRKLENRNTPVKTIHLKVSQEQVRKKKQENKREISSDDLNAVEGLMMMSLTQEDGSSSPSSHKDSISKKTEHMQGKDKIATKSKEEIPKNKLGHQATEVRISYKKLTDDVKAGSGDADAQPSSFLAQISSMLDASKRIIDQPAAEYDETMNGVVAEIVEVSSSNSNIADILTTESSTLQFKSFVDLVKEKLAIENDDGYGYRCGICSKEYKNKCTIRTHLRSHSIREIKTCEFCGKNFVNACTYEEHRRIHTNEKPYSCDLCGRSFGHRLSLKAHKIAHTTERPYKCVYCNKSFKRESYLSIHVKIHTGERPYQCNLCSKSFTHSQSLKIHLKTHARHLAGGNVKQRDRYQDLNVSEHEQGLMTYNMLTDAWNRNNTIANQHFTVQELHPYAANTS